MENLESISQLVSPLKFVMVLYLINKIHTLNSLIIIEYMAIIISIMMFKIMDQMNFEFYMILFLVILLITESIVGLSVLISMIRTHGSDYIKSSSVMKF